MKKHFRARLLCNATEIYYAQRLLLIGSQWKWLDRKASVEKDLILKWRFSCFFKRNFKCFFPHRHNSLREMERRGPKKDFHNCLHFTFSFPPTKEMNNSKRIKSHRLASKFTNLPAERSARAHGKIEIDGNELTYGEIWNIFLEVHMSWRTRSHRGMMFRVLQIYC